MNTIGVNRLSVLIDGGAVVVAGAISVPEAECDAGDTSGTLILVEVQNISRLNDVPIKGGRLEGEIAHLPATSCAVGSKNVKRIVWARRNRKENTVASLTSNCDYDISCGCSGWNVNRDRRGAPTRGINRGKSAIEGDRTGARRIAKVIASDGHSGRDATATGRNAGNKGTRRCRPGTGQG